MIRSILEWEQIESVVRQDVVTLLLELVVESEPMLGDPVYRPIISPALVRPAIILRQPWKIRHFYVLIHRENILYN